MVMTKVKSEMTAYHGKDMPSLAVWCPDHDPVCQVYHPAWSRSGVSPCICPSKIVGFYQAVSGVR